MHSSGATGGFLANLKSPEHVELVECVGGRFDAEAFDASMMNRTLAEFN